MLDPASGSGGMFVQTAGFVRRTTKTQRAELVIHGHEKDANRRVARMNLAVHGLSGDIRESNTLLRRPA